MILRGIHLVALSLSSETEVMLQNMGEFSKSEALVLNLVLHSNLFDSCWLTPIGFTRN